MKIQDLQVKQGNVDIILDVLDVSEPREFQKFGKAGKVATAIVKDDTGDCKLSLWNDDIDKIKSGDRIHITNGYVNEWQGEKQLTTGRLGKIEVIKESEKQIKKEQGGDKEKIEGEHVKKEEPLDEPQNTEEEEIE